MKKSQLKKTNTIGGWCSSRRARLPAPASWGTRRDLVSFSSPLRQSLNKGPLPSPPPILAPTNAKHDRDDSLPPRRSFPSGRKRSRSRWSRRR